MAPQQHDFLQFEKFLSQPRLRTVYFMKDKEKCILNLFEIMVVRETMKIINGNDRDGDVDDNIDSINNNNNENDDNDKGIIRMQSQ